jgi:hypothetical protein
MKRSILRKKGPADALGVKTWALDSHSGELLGVCLFILSLSRPPHFVLHTICEMMPETAILGDLHYLEAAFVFSDWHYMYHIFQFLPCTCQFIMSSDPRSDPPSGMGHLTTLKHLKRLLKRSKTVADLNPTPATSPAAPRIILPNVETQLEMYQQNGLVETLTPDRRSASNPEVLPSGESPSTRQRQSHRMLIRLQTAPMGHLPPRPPQKGHRSGRQRWDMRPRENRVASYITCRRKSRV